MVPLAVELYTRYLRGESVEDLSMQFGIPSERIEQRLRAAEAYTRRLKLAA